MLWLSVVGLVGASSCILFGLGPLSPTVFGVSGTAWLAYRRLKKASTDAAKEAHENRKNEISLKKCSLMLRSSRLKLKRRKYSFN